MTRFNEPNYKALVLVFAPGAPYHLCDFTVEQVIPKGAAAVEAINDKVVKYVEGLADRTGLEYRVCLPHGPGARYWYVSCRRVDISR